jgi:YidC/Oxa1 family membrane protein insertase
MFGYLYNTFIFIPLYNGLIGLITLLPWIDAGIAVILFTIIIRLILFPISRKAIIAQIKMREIQPELDQLKITYKDDKQAQSAGMLKIYKERGVNPFSSVLLLFIQLPIMYALYSVFIRSGLPVVNIAILYHFIAAPVIKIHFLGLFDVTKSSIILSLGAAVAQYLQLEFSLNQMKKTGNKTGAKNSAASSQADMAQNMTKQMKYIFPVIIFIISYRLSGVLSLYWITTNLFTLAQEFFVRHRIAKEGEKKVLMELEAEKF